MSGLEPGEIFRGAVLVGHLAEADERVHLVNFAIDRALHLHGVMHVRIGGIFQQVEAVAASARPGDT